MLYCFLICLYFSNGGIKRRVCVCVCVCSRSKAQVPQQEEAWISGDSR